MFKVNNKDTRTTPMAANADWNALKVIKIDMFPDDIGLMNGSQGLTSTALQPGETIFNILVFFKITGNHWVKKKIFGTFYSTKNSRVTVPIILHFFELWYQTQYLHSFYVIIMSRTSFRVNLHSYSCLNVEELLARNRRHI